MLIFKNQWRHLQIMASSLSLFAFAASICRDAEFSFSSIVHSHFNIPSASPPTKQHLASTPTCSCRSYYIPDPPSQSFPHRFSHNTHTHTHFTSKHPSLCQVLKSLIGFPPMSNARNHEPLMMLFPKPSLMPQHPRHRSTHTPTPCSPLNKNLAAQILQASSQSPPPTSLSPQITLVTSLLPFRSSHSMYGDISHLYKHTPGIPQPSCHLNKRRALSSLSHGMQP